MNGPAEVSGSPSERYHRLTTARGVEFHINPQDVRTAQLLFAILVPFAGLVLVGPLLAFVGFVGYELTGKRWWGFLPAGVALVAYVVVVGRWAVRWADREGRKFLLVEPDGRIVFDGETLLPPGRATAVRVERVEGWDDGPVVHFQVIVDAPGERVRVPVPGAGQWSTYAQHWHDWTFGFDTPEAANRFATEIAGALGSDRVSVTLHATETSTGSSNAS
jgi:hypothetical protein